MWRTVTKWVIIIAGALLVGYDIWVVSTPERNDEISVVLRDWAGVDRLWILPYYMSVLIGHWYINLWSKTLPYGKVRYVILGTLGITTLVLNLTIVKDIPWYISVPGGLATGALLWGQQKKN